MHILIVTQYFWPENFRVNDLAAGLVERGYEVTVLTGVPNYPHGRFFRGYGLFKNRTGLYRGCRVIRVPLVPRGKSRPAELLLNYLSFAATASVFAPWVARRGVDAILVCQLSPATVGIPAVVATWLRPCPLALWVLDLWPESLSATGAVSSRAILGMVGRLVSQIYRRSDVILASSKGFVPLIEQRGGAAGAVHHFPNWVDKCDRAPDAIDAGGVDLPAAGFRLMFAGNIGRAQSFETIVGAATRLKTEPSIHWCIVGDGRMRPWLEQEVAVRGLSETMHLLGSQRPEAMQALFAQADALLVTLGRDNLFALTAPGKLQSYLASGKLVVGALEGEGRRILEESGAGVVCPPEDPDALADAVLTAFKMPESQRASMGSSGKRYCEDHFEREALLDRLDSWLRALVSRA
jgi:colanic acid biosynthesis glycosyl transferase WcaI